MPWLKSVSAQDTKTTEDKHVQKTLPVHFYVNVQGLLSSNLPYVRIKDNSEMSTLHYLRLVMLLNIHEPGHEKMCLMPYANNKGADQPAHPRSLISAFVVRCQDRMIPLVYISEISRF